MEDKRLTVLINDVIKLCEGFFTIACGIVDLAVLETKRAGKNLLKMMGLLVLLFLVGISTWICGMMALAVGITFLFPSILVSLLLVTLLNVAIVVTLYLQIRKCRANATFSATRFQLKKIKEEVNVPVVVMIASAALIGKQLVFRKKHHNESTKPRSSKIAILLNMISFFDLAQHWRHGF